MGYKSYDIAMLAEFSGRPVAAYGNATTGYAATSAIPQALLLFKIGTCLASPDDLTETQQELVDFAIIAMADYIVLAQEYQEAAASPFNSETIGSYSYSKTAKAAAAGAPTGVSWFDMAIDLLSVCDSMETGDFGTGGVEMFEHDGIFAQGSLASNVRYLGPAEITNSRGWGWDPAPGLVVSR